MGELSIKPVALRAVQGHKQKVTDRTPYDHRFEEEDARGDLRTTPILHSSQSGEIPFLVHSTKKGVRDTIIESILQNGIYNAVWTTRKPMSTSLLWTGAELIATNTRARISAPHGNA